MCYIVFRCYSTRYVIGRADTTKIGPNDAKRVVWTLGELSLLFIHVFSYKLMFYNKYSIYYYYYSCFLVYTDCNSILYVFLYCRAMERLCRGYNEVNGPK